MNYGNMHFEFARNAGKQWLAEVLAQAESVVPLEQMINVVENYLLMKTGQMIRIRLRTFPDDHGHTFQRDQLTDVCHLDLQLLGRAYDIATGEVYRMV